MTAPQLFDRQLIAARRDRAARAAPELPDFLLSRAIEDIAARVETVTRSFPRALCLGAYHGLAAHVLAACANPPGEIVSVELSAALSRRCPGVLVIGDEEWLPFHDGSFDLIVSALSLQLVNDLPGALVQIRRALKPDGLFLGAVLGGATLAELRDAFMAAELEMEGGVSPRVAPMGDLQDFGGLLQRTGFAMPVVDADSVDVTYASPIALMRDLRNMGATNALTARRRTFLRRATLARMLELYHERYPAPDEPGRVKATFEIIHLTGWAPDESQPKPLRPGSARVRLEDALGALDKQLKGEE